MGQGAGNMERPIGACSRCRGFGNYYRACPIKLGLEAAAQAEKDFAAKGGGKDGAKGKEGNGKGKGESFGKGKGVYGVDGGDDAWEGEPVAWADAQWAAETEEHAGAVYEQDEQCKEFCNCIDFGSPELE